VSQKNPRRWPKPLLRALDQTGMDYEFESRSKHVLVKLEGQIVGVLPHGKTRQSANAPPMRLLLSRIRRYATQGRT